MIQIQESPMIPDFSVAARFHRYFNHQPAKVCIFQLDAASGFEFLVTLASGFLWALCVSLGFSTQSDGSRMRNLSRQLMSGSSPFILPQSCLLLSLLRQLLPFCFRLSSNPFLFHGCLCIWYFHCFSVRVWAHFVRCYVAVTSHPQPPLRRGHRCTVGVNRDPPV